jgi:hypothetical protein
MTKYILKDQDFVFADGRDISSAFNWALLRDRSRDELERYFEKALQLLRKELDLVAKSTTPISSEQEKEMRFLLEVLISSKNNLDSKNGN